MSTNKFTTNNKTTLVAVSNSDGETPVYLYADPSTHGLVVSSGSGGGAVTIADGADVAEGATTDAVVAAGAAGTISAKLRRLTTDLDAVKTSVASLDSKTTAVNTGAVIISSGTVTANIGTTNGLALDASVTGLQVAQGSTTSGQKGELMQGAVTTAAPSYTTAQTSPLSLDTSGGLRVSTHAVSQSGTWTVGSNSATGSAVPANAFYLAGSNPVNGNLTGLFTGNNGDGQGSAGYVNTIAALFNGSNYDRGRSIINATNSTGTGIAAVGLTAQLDDTSPTTITENQFGNLRIAPQRELRTAQSYDTRSDTFTTTSNGTTVSASTRPLKNFSIQVKGTGAAATTWDIRLEGSLDNTNFTQIVQHTNTDGDGVVKASTSFPVLYFRSRAAGLTLGSATNVVVTILGTE